MPRRHRPLLQEAIDWRSYLVPGDARYVPDTVRPQMPDVVARALAAGATPPLEYMGAGMTGIVFCSGDVAYKVARDTRPIDHQFFEEEADWLAVAVRVPAVSPHVAHFLDFDPDNLVITRDCARADPDQSAWRYGENKLHDLHRQIERAMIPHGWTAPEFKPDSYVLTTSGPVLVDASMPSRVGEELARYVEAVVADERPLWTTRPQDLAFAVRMEAGRTLSQAESDRFEALILQRWPPDDGEVGELHQKNGLRDKREPNLSYLLGPKGTIRAIGHEDGPDPPRDGIARYRSPEGSYRYVYYVRGEPVSALQVMTRDKKHARVANAWTAPRARRHGYASKLLQQARRDFKTVEHSDDQSPDAVAWIGRVGETTSPLEALIAATNVRYPVASNQVDGRHVRSHVPNTESIDGYFADQETLPGVRVVPISDLGGPRSVFYAADDFARSERLADAIQASEEINPLIIGVDEKGPFIIEGAHRFVALWHLKAKEFPAVVVVGSD